LYLGSMETRYQGLDSFWRMIEVPAGKPLPLVEGVSDLKFEYYGYDSESEIHRWFSSWIGDQMRAVPEAVRIQFDDQQLIVASHATFSGSNRRGRLQRLIQR
jgi:hypothetical protein